MEKSTIENAEKEKVWVQLCASIAVAFGVFTTGCHTGWPAPAIPQLISDQFPFNVTNDDAANITIIGHVGNALGTLVGSVFLFDSIGRRKSILLLVIPQIVSFILIALSYEVLILIYIARFIGGISEGMTFIIIPVYIAEISSPRIRGSLGTIVTIACVTGYTYVNLIGSYNSVRITALLCLPLPFIFLALFWKMPDSPYFLLMKNKTNEAEAALKFLRQKEDVSVELNSLTKDVNRQMSESGTYSDLFRIKSNRKALFLTFGGRALMHVSGNVPFNLYMQVLLRQATNAVEPHIGASILLAMEAILAGLSTLIVDRYGRKPILLFSCSGVSLMLLIQAIYFYIREYTTIEMDSLDWFPLGMMVMYFIAYSCGLSSVVSIISSEIFSASVKGKALSVINISYAFGMMGTTKFYQYTADNFGLVVPYSGFGIASFCGIAFVYFCLPETKGKTLEEIQQILKGKKSVNKNSEKNLTLN